MISSRSGSLYLAISLSTRKLFSSSNVKRFSVAQHDAGAHPLAELRIGHGNAGDVLHRGMREDQVLDFLGADFFAAAVDQVFLAALDHVVAGRMLAHQVAGTVEAIGGELRALYSGTP